MDNDRELGFILTERRIRRYPAEQITDKDYADDIAVTNNTLQDANTLLLKIELAVREIGLNIDIDKTEYIKFNQNNNLHILESGNMIKRVEDFKYLGSYIKSTDRDVNIRIAKAWAALNSVQSIWKSKL